MARMQAALFLLVALMTVLPEGALGQYRLPPDEVVKILDAPTAPSVAVSPDHRRIVLAHRKSMPSIEDQSQPMLRIGGRRINPALNDRFGPKLITGFSIVSLDGDDEIRVEAPQGGWGMPSFSPNGDYFAVERAASTGIELWIVNSVTGVARNVVGPELNSTSGQACQWMPDTDELLCLLVPETRGEAPGRPQTPSGPVIQESDRRDAPVRTYQDLMKSPYDERLYDHYMTAQLALVHASTGTRQPLGPPSVFAGVSPSPDGQFLLVARRVRPYSYLVPDRLFPRSVEVWDRRGDLVSEVHAIGLGDQIPIGGVYDGPRGHRWMPGNPSTILFTEALDGGDPKREVSLRDRVMVLDAPFTGEAETLTETEFRYLGMTRGPGGLAFLTEYDRPTRTLRTWKADVTTTPVSADLLWERNSEDRYSDPGNPVLDALGERMVERDGWIYLRGAGASEQGDRPFLDRMNLETGEIERLFQSDEASYERVVAMLDEIGRKVLTLHESQVDAPNYYVRDLRSDSRDQVTAFPNPFPELNEISKELVVYERPDGVQLSGTLYLPPGYDGGRLPTVVWAYPREYSNSSVASQVQGSPHRFPRISGASHLFFLTQGYAVFDGPTMPIVGGDVANDTYVEQLVSSAQAAVDKVVEMGVADPARVGVGGHSYGAFMTANLLAHSDIFAAGIARSGAYNRSLTPFGFQSERRTFWEVPELYFEMSPFMNADQINEPMLMIHGMADNNSGTFPVQSERMYHAIKGLGGKARLVMLPNESHGYRARESVLHALAEMLEWFDRYVKKNEAKVTTEGWD